MRLLLTLVFLSVHSHGFEPINPCESDKSHLTPENYIELEIGCSEVRSFWGHRTVYNVEKLEEIYERQGKVDRNNP